MSFGSRIKVWFLYGRIEVREVLRRTSSNVANSVTTMVALAYKNERSTCDTELEKSRIVEKEHRFEKRALIGGVFHFAAENRTH